MPEIQIHSPPASASGADVGGNDEIGGGSTTTTAKNRVAFGLKRRVGKWRAKNKAYIGTPSIKRLARKGGVKRLGRGVYDETRACLREYLSKILRDLCLLVEHANRYTVTTMDVVYALKRNGHTLYGYGDFTYPLTRQQRVQKLRSKKIRVKDQRKTAERQFEREVDARPEETSADLQPLVELVQKTLADYFMRERADVCPISSALEMVNGARGAAGESGAIAIALPPISDKDLRECLGVLQCQNCVMCSSDDIYLI